MMINGIYAYHIQAERLLREAEGMRIVMDAAAYACLMTAYNR